MKLSTFTISALLLAGMSAGAQSKSQAKPAKQKPKTNEPAKPKRDKTAAATRDSVKPINKNPDHYYCPPCGMG